MKEKAIYNVKRKAFLAKDQARGISFGGGKMKKILIPLALVLSSLLHAEVVKVESSKYSCYFADTELSCREALDGYEKTSMAFPTTKEDTVVREMVDKYGYALFMFYSTPSKITCYRRNKEGKLTFQMFRSVNLVYDDVTQYGDNARYLQDITKPFKWLQEHLELRFFKETQQVPGTVETFGRYNWTREKGEIDGNNVDNIYVPIKEKEGYWKIYRVM